MIENSSSRTRLTLPPGGFPKFSSLFAIVQLLHALNAISLGRLLARYTASKNQNASFHSASEWKLDTIAEDARLSPNELRGAVVDAWMYVSPYSSEDVSQVLRGCVKCFDGDFHAALFQCRFVEACPVHGLPLINCCPQCGRSRPYTLSAIKRRQHPFACECMQAEWNLMTSTARRREWSVEMDVQLMEYLSWITAARTTLSVVEPHGNIRRRDGALSLVHSHGSPLERLATACAALGSPLKLPKGVQVHGAVKTLQIAAEVLPVHLEMSGDGAGGRAVHELFKFPGNFAYDFRTNIDHSREAAVGRAKAFIKRTILTVGIYTETHHRECMALQNELRMFSTDRVVDSICTLIAAYELLKRRWNDDQFIESAFNAYVATLHGAMKAELDRHDRVPAHFLASELVSHKLIGEITEIARIAQKPEDERALPIIRLAVEAPEISDPPFSLACSVREMRIDSACAVLCEIAWQDEWARACFLADNHHIVVRQRYEQVEKRIKRAEASIDGIRRPKT